MNVFGICINREDCKRWCRRWNLLQKVCCRSQDNVRGQRSQHSKSLTPPSVPWRAAVASRDPGSEQKMKNESCMEFWWDEGTGSVLTKIISTCILPLDYKGERSVWGVWLHVPAEAIRVPLWRWHHLRSSDVASDQQTTGVWILLSTRGCSAQKTNDMNIRKEFLKLLPSLVATTEADYMSPRGSGME